MQTAQAWINTANDEEHCFDKENTCNKTFAEVYDEEGNCKGCCEQAKNHHEDCSFLANLPASELPEALKIVDVANKITFFEESQCNRSTKLTVTPKGPGVWNVKCSINRYGEEEIPEAEVSWSHLCNCAGYVTSCEHNAQLHFGAVAEAVSTSNADISQHLSSLGYTFGATRKWTVFLINSARA